MGGLLMSIYGSANAYNQVYDDAAHQLKVVGFVEKLPVEAVFMHPDVLRLNMLGGVEHDTLRQCLLSKIYGFCCKHHHKPQDVHISGAEAITVQF